MENNLPIEVVYATQSLQSCVNLNMLPGSTIRQAIIAANFAAILNDATAVGIFGKRRSLDFVLQAGDRVEIYSPLLIDPKQARKERAKKSKHAKQRKT